MRAQSRRDFMIVAGAAALTAGCASQAGARSFDLVVKGGRVIDPARKIDGLFDVAIAEGRIASVAPTIGAGAAQILDASGKLVVPGLVDIHTHATTDANGANLMLADGVTGWIDAGSQGADGIAAAVASVRASPDKAGLLVNIGRKGAYDGGDTLDINRADVAAAREAIAQHPDLVVGVKARLSRNIAGDHDLEVLRRAQLVATEAKLPVMIHIGDTFTPLGQLLDVLKPGDIVTHMYAPKHAIVDDAGKIIPEAIAARKRGVIFDWGHGTREHILWSIAEQAIKDGFLPDTISTDWTNYGAKSGLVNMPTVMSNVLSLGLPLDQIIAMSTCNAARAFPLFKGRGTLSPGAIADVAVMELRPGAYEFQDNFGNKRAGTQKFFTSATVLAGKVVPRAA